jgi:hypothetical protein
MCITQAHRALFFVFIFIDFFHRVFGRFVKRGIKKTRQAFVFAPKSIWAHHKKRGFVSLLFPPSIFSYRVFGRFVTRREKKYAIKKIAEHFPQPPKKLLTYLCHFFSRPPLVLRELFSRGPPKKTRRTPTYI